MSNKQAEDNQEPEKVKFEICHFRVPLSIKEENGKKVATFKEVEMKDLCFKKEVVETIDSDELMEVGKKVAKQNNFALKIAAKTNQDGDMATRKILCKFGKINLNTNI